jgi:hypothetical protein
MIIMQILTGLLLRNKASDIATSGRVETTQVNQESERTENEDRQK